MSRCWLEGEWRAYLDRELPAADMETAGRHLGTCPACSARLRELSGRAERVGALMGALEYIPESRPCPEGALVRPAPRWKRPWVAAAALAAALAGLLLFRPAKHPAVDAPKPAVAAVVPGDQSSPLRSQLRTKPAIRAAAAGPGNPRLRTKERSPQPEYYIGLDDEPIESGVVVQVTLPDSGLLAEVIYDDYGRPRAVRPLN